MNFEVNDVVVEYADGVKPGATCDVTIAKAVDILGDTLSVPEGKDIDHWTLNGQKVNTGAKVSDPDLQNKTLVATLKDAPKPASFTVTFDLNYEPSADPWQANVESGKTVDKPTDPQREGYTFAGWTTDKEGKNKFDFATPVTSDLNLFAQWTTGEAPKPQTFTVTFNANFEPSWGSYEVKVDSGKTVPQQSVPQREGYTFAGWTTDKEGKNKFDFATPVTSDLNLFAQWTTGEAPKPQTFTVYFGAVDPEDPSIKLDDKSLEREAGQTVGEIPSLNTPGYYIFGWYNGDHSQLYTADQVKAVKVDSDLVFVAALAKKTTPQKTYKVTFGVIDPTDNRTVLYGSTFEYLNGQSVKAPETSKLNIPSGYQLIGWRDNNNTFWSSVDGFKVGTAIKADTTFSAVLAKKDAPKGYYKVTFYWRDNNGHHVSSVNVVKNGKLSKGEVPVPSAFRHHTFYGWFDRSGHRLDLNDAVTADTVYVGYWCNNAWPKPPVGPNQPDVPSTPSTPSTPSVKKVPVYRLYDPASGLHLYTADENERKVLSTQHGWNDEGVVFYATTDKNAAGAKPVYRLTNKATGRHLLTLDENERKVLSTERGWTDEGVAWYQTSAGTVPVYRMYSESKAEHLYTTDLNEYTFNATRGWTQEGVAWKGL
ncbi:InlB B-repeat-containing protein [Bifidobacterium callitrichos]|uniref:InlB B-repeat-containing protein n=1 Tax=Bifidobacterium callitrichos TaxID=762209 RepID=UPI0015E6E752|nr:InlB B-repeat-containing protein [Bifidobacterium callitrichos]